MQIIEPTEQDKQAVKETFTAKRSLENEIKFLTMKLEYLSQKILREGGVTTAGITLAIDVDKWIFTARSANDE